MSYLTLAVCVSLFGLLFSSWVLTVEGISTFNYIVQWVGVISHILLLIACASYLRGSAR